MSSQSTHRVLTQVAAAPTTAHLAAIDSAIAAISPPAEMADWFETYCRTHRQRFATDLALFEQYHQRDDRVVEFGATPPVLTLAMARHAGATAVTAVDIDPSKFADAFAAAGVTTTCCDLESESLPFEDDSFGMIIFNEIFEHLRADLIAILQDLRRILRPGGLLLLSTPNQRSLAGIYNLLFQNRSAGCCPDVFAEYQKLQNYGFMGHVREYTSRDMTDFLNGTGFTVESVIYRGSYKPVRARLITRLRPKMRPFISVLARK